MPFIFQRLSGIGIGGTNRLNANSHKGTKDYKQSCYYKSNPAYTRLVGIILHPSADDPPGQWSSSDDGNERKYAHGNKDLLSFCEFRWPRRTHRRAHWWTLQ
jgi:hypothetical protein